MSSIQVRTRAARPQPPPLPPDGSAIVRREQLNENTVALKKIANRVGWLLALTIIWMAVRVWVAIIALP